MRVKQVWLWQSREKEGKGLERRRKLQRSHFFCQKTSANSLYNIVIVLDLFLVSDVIIFYVCTSAFAMCFCQTTNTKDATSLHTKKLYCTMQISFRKGFAKKQCCFETSIRYMEGRCKASYLISQLEAASFN